MHFNEQFDVKMRFYAIYRPYYYEHFLAFKPPISI
jgi:hypothetical protein